jgi:hypothetical protein
MAIVVVIAADKERQKEVVEQLMDYSRPLPQKDQRWIHARHASARKGRIIANREEQLVSSLGLLFRRLPAARSRCQKHRDFFSATKIFSALTGFPYPIQ